MGYGHLRAADALATALRTTIVEVDRPPVATEEEVRVWERLRVFYEALSRGTERRLIGPLLDRLLARITKIPRMERAERQAGATGAVRYLGRLAREGLCAGFVRGLVERGDALLATFYAPAILADAAGVERVGCVVPDADVNRVWVAADPAAARTRYFVPSRRAARRLRAYGVPADRILRTGFPLPPALVAGGALERHLANRLARLDPAGAFARTAPEAARRLLEAADPAARGLPPLVSFAIGGAGAQRRTAVALVRALAPSIRAGKARLALIAGTRRDARAAFERETAALGFAAGDAPSAPVSLLFAETFEEYVRRFDATIAETDVLFTKPSELTFFAALGLPLALTHPIGAQEVANRAWVRRRGAAVDAPEPGRAAAWLAGSSRNGELAAVAWRGLALPSEGTERILAASTLPRG
jgi:hypothetical protein